MALYQVSKVFKVEAATKQDAVEMVTNEPGELLEYVRVVMLAEVKPQGGWRRTLVSQLTGKKTGR